jgi:hypothetical protein
VGTVRFAYFVKLKLLLLYLKFLNVCLKHFFVHSLINIETANQNPKV